MKSNYLILGSKGMLGYAVSEYLKTKENVIVTLSRDDFDIAKDSMNKLEKYLSNVDVVINCAGVIKPRIKHLSIEEVLKVNSIFPHNLSKVCRKWNIKCFHVTTDCVYSGNGGMYDESDLFDADDLYGMSKNAGEPCDCMVLRTSIIGEEKDTNRSLLEWALGQSGKEVKGFVNHLWNGVTTVYLAEIIESILSKDLYKHGTYHIYSPKSVNKYQLLQIFNEVYNLNMKIKPVEAEIQCDRSLSSQSEISSRVCMADIKDQVAAMKKFFEKINK